jgi:alcohol dehydrogenase, propanol-preferring
MKAAVLERPSNVDDRPLTLREVVLPQPRNGEIVIKVEACGVCRTDLHVVEGDLSPGLLPVTPGHQAVGIVESVSGRSNRIEKGQRVGVAWLHRTCGVCRFCGTGRENLCDRAEFTGWTCNGGFAEYMTADADFVYPLPDDVDPVTTAPLLCAGIIGYRALLQTGIRDWRNAKLGIFGFGAAGHVCIQIVRARGADVYVATRDRRRHQALAEELGARWVGDTYAVPPVKLDAAIIFAPAGELVPLALSSLDKGGTLVLAGIHMSPIPQFEYPLIYGERTVRSVANNTRQDGRAFLAEALSIPVQTSVTRFGLEDVGDALIALKNDAIKGAAVLQVC